MKNQVVNILKHVLNMIRVLRCRIENEHQEKLYEGG